MGMIMKLEHIRAEIERMRYQISRQRKEIQSLQRAGISTLPAEAPLARMQATKTVDMPLRLDNANALPTYPQQKQKQQEAA